MDPLHGASHGPASLRWSAQAGALPAALTCGWALPQRAGTSFSWQEDHSCLVSPRSALPPALPNSWVSEILDSSPASAIDKLGDLGQIS